MKMIEKINPKYRLFALGGTIIIVFIITIAFATLFTNTKYTYEKVEQKLKTAAQTYYKNRAEQLPKQDGNKVTVTAEQLVESGNIKPLSKMLKNETCTASVTVMNNNSYYLYTPYLECSEYHTNTIFSSITDNSKIVTSGNGLYHIGDEYIFRGEYVDNYVTFANQNWRILKVNSDHTIRLIHVTKEDSVIWDDRYNSTTQSAEGINDYKVSRIRDRVAERYNDPKFFTKDNRSYIVSHNVCIGKRTAADDNSIECSQILEKQPLGLPRASELMIASIDPECTSITSMNCTNYNWLKKIPGFWTVTADSASSNQVFRVNGIVTKTKANKKSRMSVVLHLSGDIIYTSGDGSEKNPYIIK